MTKMGIFKNLVLFGLSCVCAIAVAEPRWSMSKLNGLRSAHVGANCFNAALAAKGFTDYLRFSDGPELRFYLQHFCKRTRGLGAKGDILTVMRDGMLEHAAIHLGNRIVFDKNSSVGGLDGSLDKDVRYGQRRMSNSDWFADCGKPECHVEAFKCESSEKVRKEMENCSAKASELGLDVLFREFENQTLTSQTRIQVSPEARAAYYKLVDSLRAMNGNEECAPFLLVQSLSVIINWHLLTMEGTRDLNAMILELRNRVLSFDHSEATLKVMAESDWAPIWTWPSDRAQALSESNGK